MTTACHLTIPGRQTSISHLRQWLREVLTDWEVSQESSWDLVLAIIEICTNIIRHGYKNGDGGEISVYLAKSGHTISATICDTAPIFIPRHIMRPPPEVLSEGGYGLFLINALMDDIIFEHTNEGVNRTILIKHDLFHSRP
jgi:anti-sigma regulatory factor (Ser/Thr protein kinase)